MTIPSSRSLIFEVKCTGGELAFIRVLRLGLGNVSSQYANFIKKTPSRSLRSLIGQENVCANPGVLTSEFSYMWRLCLLAGAVKFYFYKLLEIKQSLLEVMAMERQQYFNNLQRKLLTWAMWGWTALLSEIETLDIPSQFDIFPEAYLGVQVKLTLL